MNEIKESIVELLKKRKEMYTAEIAKELKISPTTASKYLGILEAEGKVESYTKTPYKYWRIRE